MKAKLFYLIVFVLFVQLANAQTCIYGGINFANMKFSSNGVSFSPTSIVGYNFGVGSDIQLNNSLYFNAGLQYSLKGFKLDASYGEESLSGSNKLNYLEIPLNLVYKFQLKESSKLFIQAGPYLGYVISGKEKADGETVDLDFGDGGYKRFDCGLGFGGGVEFGKIIAKVNYELGMANIIDNSEVKVRNRVFQISIGYKFEGKKK